MKIKRMYHSIALVLLLTVTSCGFREIPEPASEYNGAKEASDPSYGEAAYGTENKTTAAAVFRYLPLDEPVDKVQSDLLLINSTLDYTINGEWLYYVAAGIDADGGNYTGVSRKRISDGYQEDDYIIGAKDAKYVREQLIFADIAGNCYIFWGPGNTDEAEDLYALSKYGTDGELLWSADYAPEELLDLGRSLELGAVTEDGRVFLYNYGEGGHVFAFGQDGVLEETYYPELERLEGVAVGREGRAYGYCVTGETPLFLELGGAIEAYACPVRPLAVYSGYECGICLRTWEDMWSYEPDIGEAEVLWSWDDDRVQLDGNRIDCFFCDGESWQMMFKEQKYKGDVRQLLTFATISVGDSRKYPERQPVTLATKTKGDYYLDILVTLYNRRNTEYRIETIYEPSAKSMEMKLVQGKAADIIDISLLYADNLAEAGAFEELTEYYAASEETSWEDILEPVRNACTIKGKNVFVIPSFRIRTMIEKEAWFTAGNWTVWNFLGMGQGQQALPQQEPMRALQYCMGIRYGEHFVDYEKKESFFDNGEFRRILEECSKWDSTEGVSQGYFADFLSGDHILEEKNLATVWDVVSDTDPEYSAKIVGYPGWNGGEHELYAYVAFAINSASEQKEGAWSFLEYLLSEELQEMMGYWYGGFPSREDSFEAHLTDLYIRPGRLKPVFHTGGPELVIPDNEDIALLREIVYSSVFKNWVQGNNPLWDIVNEEAGMYFAGDSPLEETVQKIQNRVQIYLDEL